MTLFYPSRADSGEVVLSRCLRGGVADKGGQDGTRRDKEGQGRTR